MGEFKANEFDLEFLEFVFLQPVLVRGTEDHVEWIPSQSKVQSSNGRSGSNNGHSGSSNGRSGSCNGRRSAQGPQAGPRIAARGADNSSRSVSSFVGIGRQDKSDQLHRLKIFYADPQTPHGDLDPTATSVIVLPKFTATNGMKAQ